MKINVLCEKRDNMDIKQSSEKQGRPHHLSDSRTVLKEILY